MTGKSRETVGMKQGILTRQMNGQMIGDAVLLEAVQSPATDGHCNLKLFFSSGFDPQHLTLPEAYVETARNAIGNAPILTFNGPSAKDFTLKIGSLSAEVTSSVSELNLFQDQNVCLATRNRESASIVGEWLEFHSKTQGMTAALIIDRAKRGRNKSFLKLLEKQLRKRGLDLTVLVLTSEIPLGNPELPPEAHPFCVPEAPGKDRMEIPKAEPWTSPLGINSIYEMVRWRFLQNARAVVNIDLHDLLVADPVGISVFDKAVAAQSGLIEVIGMHCYPWRVREGQAPHFADHTCTQFDTPQFRRRWCIAPQVAKDSAIWRLVRIGNLRPDPKLSGRFYRHMMLRHPADSVSRIVPKTSLVEIEHLLDISRKVFHHKPVRAPKIEAAKEPKKRGRCAIVTTMKNEGPFILEWLAYHRAIGFDDFIIYTNDCTDGTDELLDLLQSRGFVQHRDNPFRQTDLKPQHAALQAADDEDVIRNATWVTCIDVDEYINIKTGKGTLDDLFKAVPDANLISMTWRLFGNGNVHEFKDQFITEQFLRCAPEFARKPHQAWGFKTLYKTLGIFKKLGVHRPKGLNPQLWEQINWVNGSGVPMPQNMFRNGWRSTVETYGYDLVQLNHYAVRSAESFLVKRDRGRVNHVDRDQGLAYWFRMNNNADEDHSILPRLDAAKSEMENFLSDPEIAAMHAHCILKHRQKIDELRETENYTAFYEELTSPRMEKLSTLHTHFGANVFLGGPNVVPDEVVWREDEGNWFFTVEHDGETQH